MSLSDEERRIIVQIEIEKARRAYQEALLLIENGFWSGSAGRLYYAVFHAVSALLFFDKRLIDIHKVSHIIFNRDYIKTGKLPIEYGRLFFQLYSICEDCEYNCTYDVEPEELKQKIEPAKRMIDTIADMVKTNI